MDKKFIIIILIFIISLVLSNLTYSISSAQSTANEILATGLGIKFNCGINCFYEVCKLLNEPIDLNNIEQLFNGKNDKISMYDLYIAAQRKGLIAIGKRINYEGLLKLKSPAIAYVQDNHFLVIERSVGNKLRIIDPPQLPTLVTKEQFESIWQGEVLVISKPLAEKHQKKQKMANAPDIEFEEMEYDFGILEQEHKATHVFRFNNRGNKELEISRVRSSCGYAAVLLTKNKLAPGQTGKIKVSYDSGLRQGEESHLIIISSNDPDEPHIYLTIAAKIKPGTNVFPSRVFLGDIFNKNTVQKKIYLANPEDKQVKVTKLTTSSAHIFAAIDTIETKGTVISVFLRPRLILGKFNEKLVIATDNQQKPKIEVPIEGNIIGDIIAVPSKFFFGLLKEGEELTRKIALTSEGRTKFTIKKIETEVNETIADVEHITTKIIKEQELYELSLTLKPKIKSGRIQGKVLVNTDNLVQPRIEIPIYALVHSGLPIASESTIQTLSPKTDIKPIELVFFYVANCHECPEVKDELLPKLKGKYGALLTIKSYDISDIKNYELLIQYEDKYKNTDNVSMKLFIGDKCLAGKTAILKELEALIQKQLEVTSGNKTVGLTHLHQDFGGQVNQTTTSNLPVVTSIDRLTAPNKSSGYLTSDVSSVPAVIVNRFQGFNAFLIASAGLLDGLNPCAFTTIVFFISLLALVGKTKPELLTVGIFFTLAVFLTYLLLGLGALQVLSSLRSIPLVHHILRFGVAEIAFIFAVLSGYDIVVYLRTKQTNNMTMQLPKGIKEKIHQVMREKFKLKGLVVATFTTGILVSLLESVCTGQVYLPTLVFMTKDSTVKFKAYSYLLLYNLMFIIPLVIIFLLALFGVTSTWSASLTRRNLVISKSLLVLLFLT
ncbi:MAG: DUF1573 domain-containing protein [bacterium]|nr:DUF1573 domain-containing protein [bacterium]